MKKIQVGAVSYLNTKPYLWGIRHSGLLEQIDLHVDYPSNIARGLADGSLDLGLVPVAVLPSLPEYHFVCDYGIACDGEVASVALFSEVPLQEIRSIQLDYQSRTSVALLKILLKEHWKLQPEFIETAPGEEPVIRGQQAALLIGDRALIRRAEPGYVFDLGMAWKEMTGLPFVFAAWVSNAVIQDSFKHQFEDACKLGIEHLHDVASELPSQYDDIDHYYSTNIHFHLDENKKQGLKLFLELLATGTSSSSIKSAEIR